MYPLEREGKADKVIHLLAKVKFQAFRLILLRELRIYGDFKRSKASVTWYTHATINLSLNPRRKPSHKDIGLNFNIGIEYILIAEGFKELLPHLRLEMMLPGANAAKINYKGLQS